MNISTLKSTTLTDELSMFKLTTEEDYKSDHSHWLELTSHCCNQMNLHTFHIRSSFTIEEHFESISH